MSTSRRSQIKKQGSDFVLYNAAGTEILGRHKTLAAAEAQARRVYAAHGSKSSKGKSRGTKTKVKRFAVVCEGVSVSRSRKGNPGRGRIVEQGGEYILVDGREKVGGPYATLASARAAEERIFGSSGYYGPPVRMMSESESRRDSGRAPSRRKRVKVKRSSRTGRFVRS